MQRGDQKHKPYTLHVPTSFSMLDSHINSNTSGSFPSTSLFVNFEYLLQQVMTANPQGGAQIFPWMMWYVWKSRNEKCFNAKDISPLDTIQLARQEAEMWRIAQIGEKLDETADDRQTDQHSRTRVMHVADKRFRCQVDGSWSDKDDWMGMGFVLTEGEVAILQRQKCAPRTQALINAEASGLIWAMQEIQERGFDGVNFGSDCQQLIKLIRREDEWPGLAPYLDDIKFLSTCFHDVEFFLCIP